MKKLIQATLQDASLQVYGNKFPALKFTHTPFFMQNVAFDNLYSLAFVK